VPNFSLFSEKLEAIFSKMCAEGKELDYVNGNETLDVATVDGQRMHLGIDHRRICADEVVSIVVLMAAMEHLGLDTIRKFMTFEPSGEANDSANLTAEGLPFNPFMWNGMLALCSLLQEQTGDALRVVADAWANLCRMGVEEPVQYCEAWEAEDKKKHYHRVMALIHNSMDRGTFPRTTAADSVVKLFFRLRSIACTSENLCGIAACIANGGLNPWTSKRIVKAENAKQLLSLMYSAGCETVSGEFSFKVGVPAKNSREGVILLAIPNLGGFCVTSPTLTWQGVSQGGLKFCFDFSETFNCHALSGDSTASAKYDSTLYHFHTDTDLCHDLLHAAEMGNFPQLKVLENIGFDLSYADYDHRSVAHVAAARGHISVLKYLFKHNVDMAAQDRWGITPVEEAMRTGNEEAARALKFMIQRGQDLDDTRSNTSRMSYAPASAQRRSVPPCAARELRQGSKRLSVTISPLPEFEDE